MQDTNLKIPIVKQLTATLVVTRDPSSSSSQSSPTYTLYLERRDSDDMVPVVNIPEDMVPKLEL